jgi:hypothetical protein
MLRSDSAGVAFATEPASFFDNNYTKMHSKPHEALTPVQLGALQYRFDTLRDNVPILRKFADRLGIAAINTLDSVIPLLFDHTIYKSYPSSFLQKGQFSHLTRWLNTLTSHDLSGVDASGCKDIVSWMAQIEAQSPLKLCHSSGTTGILSFQPYSKEDWSRFGDVQVVELFQNYGEDPEWPAPQVDAVFPYYRSGGTGFLRVNDNIVKNITRSEERFHTLYKGELDSDVVYLAARIRAAKAKGELNEIWISPEMQARQKEFALAQAHAAEDTDKFFERILRDLAGRRIFALATWNLLYEMAQAAAKRGMAKVFAANSVIVTGGGKKVGPEPPPNWEDEVTRFLGIPRLKWCYGMTEMCASNPMCAKGHYHVSPWIIPFVLDPDTSEPLARTGTVTGRFAFYDLLPEGRWGGYITGDEVTVHWDGDCGCGAKSAYIERAITRYSAKRGFDDKINCASTADEAKEAMDFLAERAAGAGR